MEYLCDSCALDRMAELLSGQDWSPDTLEVVADILRATGRAVVDTFEARQGHGLDAEYDEEEWLAYAEAYEDEYGPTDEELDATRFKFEHRPEAD